MRLRHILRYLPVMVALALISPVPHLLGKAPFAAQASDVRTWVTSAIYLPVLHTAPRNTVPTRLEVYVATHLGGIGDDVGTAVDIAPDGTVVFGGVFPQYQPPVQSSVLLDGSTGLVLRFDATGRQLRSATRIGASIADLEVGPDGTILVCGDFGIAALDATADHLRWHYADGPGRRCAIGADGTSAALIGNEALVFSSSGTLRGRWVVTGGAQQDIAVDADRRQVIVTGYTQVGNDLQLPYVRAYTYNGSLRWRAYDFSSDLFGYDTADARGERVAIGRDGKLYVAGSINGGTGASAFARDPQDSARSVADRTILIDKYTNPFNVGSVTIAWFGRFDPENGRLERSQSLLTRRADDRANSISIAGITADAEGRVYLVGRAAAFIAERDRSSVAETRIGPYSGDAYALVITPDWRQRLTWVAFTAPSGGQGYATAVSMRDGTVALAATVSQGDFVTYQALYPFSAGGSDAYLVVWPR